MGIRPAALISAVRREAGITQHDLARRAGTSQPALARLERGHASPTVATLERLLAAAGFGVRVTLVPRPPPDPVIEAYKRDIDRTLLRENLRKPVDQRLRELAEHQSFGRELREATKRAKRSGRKR